MSTSDPNARLAARVGRIILQRELTAAELQSCVSILTTTDGLKKLARTLIARSEIASLSLDVRTTRAYNGIFGRHDPNPPAELNHWLTILKLGDITLNLGTDSNPDLIRMFSDIRDSDYRADPCAAPIDLDGKIFAVRDSAGSPMVFATGENAHLYLFKLEAGAWRQTDLSAALPSPAHAHVQAVDIRQAPDNTIDIALAVGPRLGPTGGDAISSVYVASGLSDGLDSAAWLNVFRTMVKRTGGPDGGVVSGITLARSSADSSPLVMVGASIRTVMNTWYFDIHAAVDAVWTPLRIPEDADKVLCYAIGQIEGRAGVWTLYRVGPSIALTFTTFTPDQYGKHINLAYTEIPAGATSFIVAPGVSPLPDVYVAGEGISVYRGTHSSPEVVTVQSGATVLWTSHTSEQEHVAYVDSKESLQIVSKSDGGTWSPPYSITQSVEVAALLGSPLDGRLQAIVVTQGVALELRTVAAPRSAATVDEIPISAVWPEDPLTLAELRLAMAKAAPIMYFDTDEAYLPSTVEFYLQRVGLWSQIKREWQIPNGQLWDAASGDMTRTALSIFPRSSPDSESHDSDYCLRIPDQQDGAPNRADVPNKSDSAYLAILPGHPQDAPFYVNAKFAPAQNATDLVCWGFFPYNGGGMFKLEVAGVAHYIDLSPLGEHEGDWEHVLIRVDNNTLAPTQVYMSAHDGGAWIDLSELGRDAETGRYEIYMSKHGHASYANAGDNLSNEHDQGELWTIGLVNRCSKGLKINLGDPGRLALISAGFAGAAEPLWLQLPWRWGRFYDFTPGQLEEVSSRVLGFAGGSVGMQALQDAVAEILVKKKVLGDEGNSAGPQALKFKNNWFGPE